MLLMCYNASRFEKLMRAAKKADNDFRGALKSVGPSTKFKLDEEPKEVSTLYSTADHAYYYLFTNSSIQISCTMILLTMFIENILFLLLFFF